MELLMDNLKAALLGKGAPAEQAEEGEKRRAGLKELSGIAVKVIAVLAVSFIAARVSFFYIMYPCGLALLTVLMARGRGAIYALGPLLAGQISAQGLNAVAVGGVASTLVCGAVFYLIRKKEISLTGRALLAAGICVGGKTAVSIALHSFYTYDGFSVLGEGLLVLFFVFIFAGLFSLVEKENPVQPVAANIFILTVSGLLLTGGVLPQSMAGITPLNVAALFIVLLTGYRLGVMEGATAGVAAGLMLFGIANQGPAIMGILACGGMAAGLLRGEKRICAATCFCAVCLSFGFLKGYPNLYVGVLEPVLASLVFFLMPNTVLEKADRLLAKAGRDDAYYELLEKNRILSVLNEYRETFSYLALVYGPGKDGKRIPRRSPGVGSTRKEERSGRSVASYQFAGVACALDGMMNELRHVERPVLIKEERFTVKLATAGYARCEGISGDSTLCNHIKKGQYLLALADGMGKGQKAAQESNLTLNTLYNLMRAGFEPELALRMINSLLLMKSTEEIFSTVDMGLINLYTGRLRLFKIGAATTFIKRGGKVETVKASSLPLGMVEKISVDSIEVSLRKGDQIIIVSDGITEADRGRVLPSDISASEGRYSGDVIEINRYGARASRETELRPILGKTGTEFSAQTEKADRAEKDNRADQADLPGEGWKAQADAVDDTMMFARMAEPEKRQGSKKEDDGLIMDWSAICMRPDKKEMENRGGCSGATENERFVEFDWTAPPEETKESQAAAALAERIKIRNNHSDRNAVFTEPWSACGDSQAAARSVKCSGINLDKKESEADIHEDWLKETIAEIKSTDPQTVADLILNRAVERCGLKEKDDMTVITAYIS